MVDVILGLQWGDEGKGKIVDYFAPNYDVIARFQGGPNAGHTLYVGDKKVVLHQIPSGVFHQNTVIYQWSQYNNIKMTYVPCKNVTGFFKCLFDGSLVENETKSAREIPSFSW